MPCYVLVISIRKMLSLPLNIFIRLHWCAFLICPGNVVVIGSPHCSGVVRSCSLSLNQCISDLSGELWDLHLFFQKIRVVHERGGIEL